MRAVGGGVILTALEFLGIKFVLFYRLLKASALLFFEIIIADDVITGNYETHRLLLKLVLCLKN